MHWSGPIFLSSKTLNPHLSVMLMTEWCNTLQKLYYTVIHYNTVLHRNTLQKLYYTVLQYNTTALDNNTTIQHCNTTALYKTALCNTVTSHNTALWLLGKTSNNNINMTRHYSSQGDVFEPGCQDVKEDTSVFLSFIGMWSHVSPHS